MSLNPDRLVSVGHRPCRTAWVAADGLHHDSIYLSDSIYISDFVRDDTVYKTIDRWHTRYVERTRTDTLYQARTDSIPVPVEVEKQVPAPLSWWQQTRLHLANIMLYLLAAVAIIYAGKICLRK